MFSNPTAAVNQFHVGKQYLSFCKAKAAVTHNLICRKIISNVKRADTRNSLPMYKEGGGGGGGTDVLLPHPHNN